jgi:hypothetical protein
MPLPRESKAMASVLSLRLGAPAANNVFASWLEVLFDIFVFIYQFYLFKNLFVT